MPPKKKADEAKAIEDALDPTREPMGKVTGAVKHEARCLVCGNVTSKAICPVDGNRMGDA